MRHCLGGSIEAACCLGPFQPGAPDAGIIATAQYGRVEPALGFLELTGLQGQIGAGEPEPDIICPGGIGPAQEFEVFRERHGVKVSTMWS